MVLDARVAALAEPEGFPGERSTTGAPGCGVSGWQARQKILPPCGFRITESARTFGKSSRSEGKNSERPWTRWQFRQVVPAAGTLPRGKWVRSTPEWQERQKASTPWEAKRSGVAAPALISAAGLSWQPAQSMASCEFSKPSPSPPPTVAAAVSGGGAAGRSAAGAGASAAGALGAGRPGEEGRMTSQKSCVPSL